MAAISNRFTRLNVWVEINEQLVRALIDLGANKVYITPAYIKR